MIRRRSRFDASIDKSDAITKAEDAGVVADSMDVRTALVLRMNAGELTLAQVQEELNRIKRDAKRNGLKTRSQVWRES